MIYSIENEKLKVSVDPAGAQLQSVYSKDANTEYLWQGDKTYWGGRAYNLFPFIGRMYKNTYICGGKEYTSRTHGVESSAMALRFSFCSRGLFSVSPPAAFHFSKVSRMRGSELAMNDASAFA